MYITYLALGEDALALEVWGRERGAPHPGEKIHYIALHRTVLHCRVQYRQGWHQVDRWPFV